MTVVAAGADSVRVADLQALIKRSGRTQSKVADLLKVDAALVSNWALGRRDVPTRYLEQLAELLDTRWIIIDRVAFPTTMLQDLTVDEAPEVAQGLGVEPPVSSAAAPPPTTVAEPHRRVEAGSPPASAPPSSRPRPPGRSYLEVGQDGRPMGPSTSHTYCCCGRLVR